jgi:DNA recombination protein RmuC
VTPFAKAGRQLASAVSAYNEAVGSFDTRVVPQVRRIEQAGASSERDVQAPPALEITARAIATQAELEDGLSRPAGEIQAERLGPQRIVSGG